MSGTTASFVRNLAPYLVKIDADNNYHVLTRDEADFVSRGEEYMYNDITKPWKSDTHFRNMCDKFKEFKANHAKCLNPNGVRDALLENNSCTFSDETILELFTSWLRHMNIRMVRVEGQVLWLNENRWQTIDTFDTRYPGMLTKTTKFLLRSSLPVETSWHRDKRYPLVAEDELPEFNLQRNLRIDKLVSTRLTRNLTTQYHTGWSSWCFKGLDGGYYMFGDMYSDPRTNQGLVNFLHDFGLYDHTEFYKWSRWSGSNDYHTVVGDRLLDFHRSHVWITRLFFGNRDGAVRFLSLF